MKILYINIGMHAKNHNSLMNYKNIKLNITKTISITNRRCLFDKCCLFQLINHEFGQIS